jgi:putative ABC transport system substrate-binding protein
MITLLNTLKESREYIRPYRRIGVIYNSREIGSLRQFEEVRRHAPRYDLVLAEANVASVAALESSLASLIEHSDVIIATESGVVARQFSKIVAHAREHGVPVVSTMPGAAGKGALVSLEISPEEQGHLAADMVSRILEGANPANLSLISPRRVELIVNLRAARELGLNIPFNVLGGATRVIK